MHRLATIHERDQSTTNQPTMSRHGLLQYAPLAIVSEARKNENVRHTR